MKQMKHSKRSSRTVNPFREQNAEMSATERKSIMRRPTDLNQELRQRILNLPGVTERTNAGIHEDAFFVGRTMFMHIHGAGHCDIRLLKADQERVLADGKVRPHRWAPKAGYVTFLVNDREDLESAVDLIRMSHRYFARTPNGEQTESQQQGEEQL